ncbi:aspartate carbamoyltransferase [Candidatus Roizmanbacteria bacterium RIFCSPHIGHO2_01_FULL_39_12c]|uniref:Aspartate carbamoyltransferase n=1 Tax=Candidatus Roizmanbacteria bacterium RIFCSPHIGHO2_01_FULL_39_12c TaxID=1802031 RepID=A0A1F7GAY8_9BACT|nr:MAG: aspartate carbamoyltransferase [Candidatus Roizmanbacteria bacterium RIFCSPHIGHO2_01_FULL_39_12c]OGK46900.1 MAG: aspartate carbamoyltransferase [Candidatus Roizmanbacteria bacterium RIFCSPLOWO2_01_FULL_40_13]
MNKNPFFGRDILSSEQYSKENLEILVSVSREMKSIVENVGSTDILKGKVMTALFYEPSSRTFASFIAAMQRLGGSFIPLQGMTYSSVTKGENLEDTVRTFACYSDVIVQRHPEVGSAKRSAAASTVPIINAGDGVGEHPTQALLDYFTIIERFRKIDGLSITMVGDLLNGRTIHSLIKLVSLYKSVKINLVSPDILKLPSEILKKIKKRRVKVNEMDRLDGIVAKSDVVYVTRVQKERFTDLNLYEKLKHYYIITPQLLKKAKKTTIVMHPLPRVGEIESAVDDDPRAVYIKDQMRNGMYTRMALLSLVLQKNKF